MNRQFADRFFRVIFVFVFVIGTVWTPATGTAALQSGSGTEEDKALGSQSLSETPYRDAQVLQGVSYGPSVREGKQPESFTALSSELNKSSLLDPLPPVPPDAQSTTGPVPPPGVVRPDAPEYQPGLDAAIINNVPNYLWQHGCGPTAAGMVIGYWDAQYDWLINGSAATQTLEVNEAIASESGTQNHYSDYALPIDDFSTGLLTDLSEEPVGDEHSNNSIADFMHTSFSYYANYYGWSWFSDVRSALIGYVDMTSPGGYMAYAENYYYDNGTFNWDLLKAEIDAGRPMVLLVDSDGDGSTDHFIPAFGYDDSTGTQKYAAYNTWDGDLHWYDFRPMTPGYPWGIYGGVSLSIAAYNGPATPSDLVVTDTSLDSITISWQDNSDNEDGFNIYRWDYDGSQWTFVYLDSVGPDVTSYTQNGLGCGNDFNFYEVSAFNANGESPHTGWVQGITDACPPRFEVRPADDSMNGSEWTPNASVEIRVDGVLITTAQTDASGFFDINFADLVDLVPGSNIEVTDGTSTKTQIVPPLSVSNVDLDADIASGTATPNARIQAWICDWPNGCVNRWETADGAGNWSTNFSIPGDEPGEEQTFDIVPGYWVSTGEWDEDGDNTVVGYYLSNPKFDVWPVENYLSGWDWLPNSPIEILVDDPSNGPGTDFSVTVTSDESGYILHGFGEDIQLQPGFLITMDDGATTKEHVTNLVVTGADPDTDTVSGTASPGAGVEIGYLYDENGGAFRRVGADENGDWLADFSVPGEDADEQDLFNIRPGTASEAWQCDEDGECTHYSWRVPDTRFEVRYADDVLYGWEWQPNTDINITVDGVSVAAIQTDEWGNFGTTLMVDLVPASNVEVADGVNTKAHIVAPLSITSVDVETEIVSGTGTPNHRIRLGACAPVNCASRWETVDGEGNWSANFSLLGDEPGEEQTLDIVPGTDLDSQEWDEDGDNTAIWFRVPDPYIQVRPNDDYMSGWGWRPNVELSISIDGVSISTVMADGGGNFGIDLSETIDLVSGNNVEVTDGASSKAHVITPLNIISVDLDTDLISGTGTSNGRIYVWTCAPAGCANRWETVDEVGNWSANFSIPGDEEGEEQTLDLVAGTYGDSHEEDEDGDTTVAAFNISNPTFTARFPAKEIHGYSWPLGSSVALTIDDPNTPQPVDYTETQTVVIADWDPNLTFVLFRLWENGFNLEPGMTVSMAAGQVTKSHVVTAVIVANVDPTADTVSGTATPESLVEVGHIYCDESGCYGFRRVKADIDGNWIADFSVPGEDPDEQDTIDIQPGTGSEARQCDEDGECTAYNWRVPNPYVEASARHNWVSAREWPVGTEVTLTIDGAQGPYTTTAVMQQAPWNPGDPNDTFAPFDLQGYDIQPGDSVTATVGSESKTLLVSPLDVTNFDPENDTLSGKATPGVEIEVCANLPGRCISRFVTADAAGDWTVDYSGEFDLQPGSNGWAAEREADRDQTMYDWNVPNPRFDVWYRDGNINAYDWPLGTQLTLDIEDPATPQSPDFSTTTEVGVTPWNPNETLGEFHLNGAFEIQPGMMLTISGASVTKNLLVSDLTITSIDQDTDVITGGTEPNQMLWMYYDNSSDDCCRDFQADENGVWSVDYSQPGPDGEQVEDIRPGSAGTVNAIDEDGDNTSLSWNIVNPRLEALAHADRIALVDWPGGQNIHVTIDDPATGLLPDFEQDFMPDQDGTYYEFFVAYDMKPGDLVTATNGNLTKTLEIVLLQATEIDPNTGIVSGAAPANSQIDMQVSGDHFDVSPVSVVVDVDGSGNWSENFGNIPGSLLPWTWSITGAMRQWDEDGDMTLAYWHNHWPVLEVWMNEAELRAFDWPLGATLTFTVDDPTTYQPVDFSQQAETTPLVWLDHGGATVSVRGSLEIQPGMTVTVTDGTTTKSTVIQAIGFGQINAVNNTVQGHAPPNADLDLILGKEYWSQRYISADANGDWIVDYETPDAAGRTLDLQPGDQFHGLFMRDEDVDSTVRSGHVPNPSFAARVTENEVHGYDWMLGTQVTLTIDDPVNGVGIDFTDTQTVIVADWDPSQTFVVFRLWQNGFELQPDQLVTLTDGITTRTHTVTHLTVTAVDPIADTVSGTAEPGSLVEVGHIYCDETGCYGFRRVNADVDGNWIADFSVPGEDPDEQDIFDIVPGTGNEARQPDEDWDTTNVQWRVPNPFVEASARDNWVFARDWPLGTEVTLTIDGAQGPYTTTAIMQQAPWNPNDPNDIVAPFDLQGYDIQAGDSLTATVGAESKTLIVSQLEITGFDLENDTLSGKATPGVEVEICANAPNDCISRWVTADGSGDWTADYSGELDLQPGSNGWAAEREVDGDQTWYDWNVPSPHMDAWYQEGSINAYDWPFGTHLTLDIEDPTTPASPDYSTGTDVNGYTDWDSHVTLGTFNLNGLFEIQPGMILTISGAGSTRELLVSNLTITNIDQENDIITGGTEPDQNLWMWYSSTTPTCCRGFQADENGIWVVDYSQPGPNGEPIEDIGPGSSGTINAIDEDGDNTSLNWSIPTYTLHAVPAYPEVHGHDWPQNADITLTIDDDTDPNNGILYTQTRNVSDDPWCGEPCFDLQGVFTLEVGQYVSLTDGDVTKTVQVSVLQITEVNREADTISGVADPGSRVAVNIWSQDGLARYETADSNGNWVADFSVFGDEDFEQFTTDLTYGDNGRAIQLNPDGTDDGTLEYWDINWIAPDTIPLVAAIANDVDLGHPAYTVESWTLLNLLYEPLYRATNDGALVPAAATGYTVSPDGLVYTITLREGMQWSDGAPVTAQHYVDGIMRILAPETATDYALLLFDIQGAEGYNNGSITDPNLVGVSALNTSSLQITLARSAVYFPQILAIPGIFPARLDLITTHGDAWVEPANFEGNGPYTLLEHEAGHVLLQKNLGYYMAAGVTFEQIGLDVIPDENERFEAYKRGEVDVLVDAPAPALADPNYISERVYSNSPGVMYIGLNIQRAPTDNPLVRKALASATNRQALLEDVLNMPWRRSASGVIPPELAEYQGTAVGFEYNPTLAQDLLAQAGYPGGTGLPTVHLYGFPGNQPVLDAIADQWRAVLGISVETHYMSDFGGWIAGCEDDPSLCEYNGYRLGWLIDYFDTHNIINDAFHPLTSSIRRTGWDNARYRELIELSRGEQNPAQRTAYLQEAEQILVEDDAVVIPLYFLDRVSLVKPGFSTVFGLIPYFDQWGTAACYTLTTMVNPAGGGSITTHPMPDCPTDASKYQAGTEVTLTASTNEGWNFSGWSGDVTGTDNPVLVTMDGDKTVAANFVTGVTVPTLLAPNGTLTIWGNGFNWTGIAGADFYQLEVYDAGDALIHSQWFTTSICTDLDCVVSPAETQNLANGDYKWRVRTYGVDGFGPYTEFMSFTLNVEEVALVAPSGGQTTWDNLFTWTGLNSADFYQLEVYAAGDTLVFSQWFTSGICTGLDCAAAPAETQNLANGDYKWRVRTYGASGFTTWTEYLTFTLTIAEVTLVAPGGTLNSWDNTFRWTGIGSADFYRLEVYDASDTLIYGQWYTTSICTGLDCALSPAETLNLANGDYKWRVQTYGASGYGPWTDFANFRLSVILLGEPGGVLTSWNNVFSWTGLADADFYRLEVSDANDVLIYDQWYTTSICTGLDCAVSPAETAALGDGDYKWRVQTYGLTGLGPWTPYMNFTLNLEAVTLVAPSGTLTTWDNLFTWTGIGSADFYQLEMYDGLNTVVFSQWFTSSICSGLDCAVSPAETQNLANGDYKWAVRTYGATGFTAWTAFTSFTLDIQGVTLISPTGTLAIWDNTFSWTGVGSADFYQLEVYDASDTLIYSQWFTTSICSGLDCAVSPAETLNLANGDYKWAVRTYGATGFTAWTPYMNFTLNQ